MMKFDLVFSNPPYNANVDIKILNEIQSVAEEFVIVHPSTWILDRKHKTKLFNDFKKNVIGKLKSLEFFNGNNIFDIELFVPCVITHIQHSYQDDISIKHFDEFFDCKNIDDVTKFGKSWQNTIKPFIDKYVCHDSILNHKIEHGVMISSDKFYCQLAGVRGTPNRSKNTNHMLMDDFYTMVMKDDGNKGIRNPNSRKDAWLVWEFDSEQECDNFISYLKTDFCRFMLSILKNTGNNHYGEMELIPWQDFSEKWDDAKLFDKYGVSTELQEYIRDFLPDFHGIRN